VSANAALPVPLTFEDAPRSVLVVITRRIGDVLLATPVVRSLSKAWPGAAIDVLAFAGTEGFIVANADVRRVLTIAERPRFFEHLNFVLGLARRYDLALSLVPGDRPTLYAWLAGRRRAGLLLDQRKHAWKRRLLHAWVPFDARETHTVRMHLALLDVVGVPPAAEIRASWTPEDEKLVARLLEPLGGARYAVMHPHPKFRYKMWTREGWTAVARWLGERGLSVVLTGGSGADEREYVDAIARDVPGAFDLTGKLSLGATALVVSKAAVYVGPDTAITHAAAALGVPTVALFGPTNPVKWGPWPAGHARDANPWIRTGTQSARNVRLVQGQGACVPCDLEGCERHIASTSDCLTTLPAERVIAAIRELIG
jgi:heptosyltransferase-3